jgi:hypothetical protein
VADTRKPKVIDMKQTVEEAEKEYCDKNYPYSDLNIRLMVEMRLKPEQNGRKSIHLG